MPEQQLAVSSFHYGDGRSGTQISGRGGSTSPNVPERSMSGTRSTEPTFYVMVPDEQLPDVIDSLLAEAIRKKIPVSFSRHS